MKYEIWQKLTPEQREEYKIRFEKNFISISDTALFIASVNFLATIGLYGILLKKIHSDKRSKPPNVMACSTLDRNAYRRNNRVIQS